ncbi:hypothetical protein L1987_24203 [Smallanthus sonchifolius]|uniref:Uncharacterized protein n=1 Tax=Smallanthus sonchifolius TaxID=185202 RepID=A0ACB9IJ17_9ASTR|nr:hypothetical protein L1987_24203 [Smallanthus sonchifolius]
MNYHWETVDSVNDGMYIGFMIFMTVENLLSLTILHPSKEIRNDGSRRTNMFGSVMIGQIMDFSFKSRRTRGLAGISVVAVLGTRIWVGGLFNQRGYNYHDIRNMTLKLIDFKNSGGDLAGPFVLYSSYGLLDAIFHCKTRS